jgi:hypothetical protein
MSEECDINYENLFTLILGILTLLINAYQTFFLEKKRRQGLHRQQETSRMLQTIHDKTDVTKETVTAVAGTVEEIKKNTSASQ